MAGWEKRLSSIHKKLRSAESIGERMNICANAFVGLPYVVAPLIGSSDTKEKFTVELIKFDCVTFVETVLSIVRSNSKAAFVRELKATRYAGGEVSWKKRLHYFSDWMKSNTKRGAIKPATKGTGSRQIETKLAVIEELPKKKVNLQIVPKARVASAKKRISDGAIVAFASTSPKIDYYHVGLLFWQGKSLMLYHAAKSKNGVVKEPLEKFLKQNRMRGFAFANPV